MTSTIENVIQQKQGRHSVFVFTLSAMRLRELGFVSRLHEGNGGVQRKLDEDRSANIAVAMRNPDVQWLEPFLGQLEPEGSWSFENNQLTTSDDFRISIDDGQHRLYALQVLTEDELNELGQFTVTATFGMTFEERVRLFAQQEMRKNISKNVLLQSRYLANDWKDPLDKAAYVVLRELATNPRSKLCGRIELDEIVNNSHRYKFGNGEANVRAKILGSSIYSTLKTVLGVRSLLADLPTEKQLEILIDYFDVAATKIWPKQWEDSEGYALVTSRGINALFHMFVSSKVFRMILTQKGDFGSPRLSSALILGSRYGWGTEQNRHRPTKAMVELLDNRMSKAYNERMKNRERR